MPFTDSAKRFTALFLFLFTIRNITTFLCQKLFNQRIVLLVKEFFIYTTYVLQQFAQILYLEPENLVNLFATVDGTVVL